MRTTGLLTVAAVLTPFARVVTQQVPVGAVTRLEQSGGRGASGKGALIGAGIGLVIGSAVGGHLDGRHLSTHGSLLPLTATGGVVVGGLLGAGGKAALKGAGIGLLVGGGVGVVAGLVVGGSQDCDGSCAGLGALALGGVGAYAGVVIGAIVGMATQGDRSQEGWQNRVTVGVAPHTSGVTLRASVAF